MGIFSGIGRALINPMTLAQVAMGPAGWASLAVKTIGMAIGREVIQQLGQKLGLPQSFISLAQTAFSATAGGGRADLASVLGRAAPSSVRDAVGLVAQQFNMSPAQEGRLARDASVSVDQMVENFVTQFNKQTTAAAETSAKTTESTTTTRKGGYLQALAEAMGAMLDAKMDEITDLSDQVSKQASANKAFNATIAKDDKSQATSAKIAENGATLGTANTKLSAATQELNIMQSAMTNALKTIGEAQSSMARKG